MAKIFRDFNGVISLAMIERWCRRIREVSTIDLVKLCGCSRTIRIKAAIQKIKRRLNRRKSLSSRKLARELDISPSSVRRILNNDRELQAYKIKKKHCSLMSIKKKE